MRQQNTGVGRFYFTVFRSLSTNPKVKELLKSVHICQSYRKNKSGTLFYGPRCIYTCFGDSPIQVRPLTDFRARWLKRRGLTQGCAFGVRKLCIELVALPPIEGCGVVCARPHTLFTFHESVPHDFMLHVRSKTAL